MEVCCQGKNRIKLSRSKTPYMLVNESEIGGKVKMQKSRGSEGG